MKPNSRSQDLLLAIQKHIESVNVSGHVAPVDYVDLVIRHNLKNEHLGEWLGIVTVKLQQLVEGTGRSPAAFIDIGVDSLTSGNHEDPSIADDLFEGAMNLTFRDKDEHVISLAHVALMHTHKEATEKTLDVISMVVHQGPLASAHYVKGGFTGGPHPANLVLTKHLALDQAEENEMTLLEVNSDNFFVDCACGFHGGSQSWFRESGDNSGNVRGRLDLGSRHFTPSEEGKKPLRQGNLVTAQSQCSSALTGTDAPQQRVVSQCEFRRKVGVIYIGPGQYALDDSHLEALKQSKGWAELIAVVNKDLGASNAELPVLANDTPGGVREKIRKFIREQLGLRAANVEIDVNPARGETNFLGLSRSDGKTVEETLREKVSTFKGRDRQEKPAIAVIVGTQSRFHKAYVEWALKQGYHVLVDKPLTTPKWDTAAGDPEKAQKAEEIVTDGQALVQLSEEHPDVLAMVATQKRYSKSVQHIRKAVSKGSRVKYLQLTTNDGWWIDPDKLDWTPERGESYSPRGDGGKLAHTGYHVFDLVPLILSHQHVIKANVRAVFQRPADIVAYSPLRARRDLSDVVSAKRNLWLENGLGYDESLSGSKLREYMEINANIEIVFTRRDDSRIIVNLAMFHGGPSSASSIVGRTKTETLTLIRDGGALSAARIAKFLLAGRSAEVFSSNAEHIQVDLCPDEDPKDPLENARPAMEFLTTIATAKNFHNINQRVRTPLISHVIGIKLMAAALRAGYSGNAVTLDIAEQEWRKIQVAQGVQ